MKKTLLVAAVLLAATLGACAAPSTDGTTTSTNGNAAALAGQVATALLSSNTGSTATAATSGSNLATVTSLLTKTVSFYNSLNAEEKALFMQISKNALSNDQLTNILTGVTKSSTPTTNSTASGFSSLLTNQAALQLTANYLGASQPTQAQSALGFFNTANASTEQTSAYSGLLSLLAAGLK